MDLPADDADLLVTIIEKLPLCDLVPLERVFFFQSLLIPSRFASFEIAVSLFVVVVVLCWFACVCFAVGAYWSVISYSWFRFLLIVSCRPT